MDDPRHAEIERNDLARSERTMIIARAVGAPWAALQIYRPFGSHQSNGSVGFGLAIVRALVEAQGGAVVYEPNQPNGACFRLRLPAADLPLE